MGLFSDYKGIYLKRSFKIMFSAIIIMIAVFSSIAADASPEADSSVKQPVEVWIGEGWEYRVGDFPLDNNGEPLWIEEDTEAWKPYVLNSDIPNSKAYEYIWIRTKLPKAEFFDPALVLWYLGKRLDAYMDGKLIHSDTYLDSPGLRRTIPYYNTNLIELPKDFEDKTIYFRIKTRAPIGYINSWSGAFVTSEKYFADKILKEGLKSLIFGIALIFIGLLLTVVSFYIKYEIKSFLSFCMISLCCGMDLLSLTFISTLIYAPTIWYYAALLSAYIMPIGICLFFQQSISRKFSFIVGILWKLFALHALVMFILDLAGIVHIYYTKPFYYIAFAITAVLLIVFAIKGFKDSWKASRVIIFGVVCFGATGLFDLVHGILGINEGYAPNYPWGLFIFIVTLILSLVLRYNEAHTKSVDYAKELEVKNRSLKEAWDEIKLAHDEVAELNGTLEKRVAERTEQLEMANLELSALNEELTAINEELNATMKALTDAQVQLIQSEKINAMGKLIAGIAHELNTPIATIKSYIQMEGSLYTSMDLGDKSSVEYYFKTISSLKDISIQACDRITHIIKNLINFSRLDESEVKEVDLTEGIESTISLLKLQLEEKNIILQKNYTAIPPLECHPKLLNQVFLNLLENAIEAVDYNGRISISTRYQNNIIFIEFSDTGIGIAEEILQKIFDPGFTTKGVKLGTGLGLAISYRIIEKHGGRINVESTPWKGSKFTIELPIRISVL